VKVPQRLAAARASIAARQRTRVAGSACSGAATRACHGGVDASWSSTAAGKATGEARTVMPGSGDAARPAISLRMAVIVAGGNRSCQAARERQEFTVASLQTRAA
jgi:hypothetical protein